MGPEEGMRAEDMRAGIMGVMGMEGAEGARGACLEALMCRVLRAGLGIWRRLRRWRVSLCESGREKRFRLMGCGCTRRRFELLDVDGLGHVFKISLAFWCIGKMLFLFGLLATLLSAVTTVHTHTIPKLQDSQEGYIILHQEETPPAAQAQAHTHTLSPLLPYPLTAELNTFAARLLSNLAFSACGIS